MVEIRQLSYFLEVAKHGSFSKASEAIHLSQPTLSKMVKNLEVELDVTLFNRSTRKVVLTEAGRVVQLHAQAVIHAIDNLQVAVADLTQLKAGSFSLGLPPVIGVSFFPKVIMGFRSIYPDISIELIEEGGKRIEQLLLDGNLDLGVVVLPVNETLFEVVPIVKKHLKLVLPISHPLVDQERISLNDLSAESFIVFRQGFSLYDRVKEACIRAGFEPHIAYESSQWDFIYELVCSNQGIALLPETICDKFDRSKVAIIDMVEPQIDWNLGVIWRKDNYLSHAAQAWIQYAKSTFIQSEF